MSFPAGVRDQALIACGRHCCLCHRFCGMKIELHHIAHAAEGGDDTFVNCIPLCFDCHADMRSYDHKHPKGTKYTVAELRSHRDAWYAKVKAPVRRASADDSLAQDKVTFTVLMRALPYRGLLEFVEKTDFGGPFKLEQLRPLDDFLDNRSDPSGEFIDSDLEGLRADLTMKYEDFRYYLATNTWPMDRAEFQAVPREWEDTQPKRFIETIDRLNTMSQAVFAAYTALVREARRRLGISAA